MNNLSKLFELINTSNGTNLVPGDIRIGLPSAWAAEEDFRNTKITIDGVLDRGFTGTKELYYRRPDLGLLFKDVDVSVVVPHVNASTVDVLSSLNTQFPALGLSVDDVDLLPVLDNVEETTVTATENNLFWCGTFTVRVRRELIDIRTLFTMQTLDGFNYAT